MSILSNNRRKHYTCFYEQSHLTKQTLGTLSYPVLLVILADSPQDGDGSALLEAWCLPEPRMGTYRGRRMAASEPARGKGLEAIALGVRVISGGVGAPNPALDLLCAPQECSFMDASDGMADSGKSVLLPFLPTLLPPLPGRPAVAFCGDLSAQCLSLLQGVCPCGATAQCK